MWSQEHTVWVSLPEILLQPSWDQPPPSVPLWSKKLVKPLSPSNDQLSISLLSYLETKQKEEENIRTDQVLINNLFLPKKIIEIT